MAGHTELARIVNYYRFLNTDPVLKLAARIGGNEEVNEPYRSEFTNMDQSSPPWAKVHPCGKVNP
jgi:hypothetical protein